MAVLFEKCRIIQEEEDTPGGTTYYIKLPGERDIKKLCFRKIRKDQTMRCTNPAGYQTWHPGTGACKYHGGQAHKNGKKAMRHRLKNQIDAYLQRDRGELMDLTAELAATKVVFEEFLSTFPTPEDKEYGIQLQRFQQLIGTMGTLVEKISRNEARSTLTAAQALYIRATVADILMKYLSDPDDRVRAAKELAARMGGDVEIELQRNEYSLSG